MRWKVCCHWEPAACPAVEAVLLPWRPLTMHNAHPQAQEDGPAVMRLAPRPVVPQDDQCAGVIEAITSQKPVPVEEGRSFSGCEMQHGQWRNYLVGVIGELSLDDDEMMWPNQVRRSAAPIRRAPHAPTACPPPLTHTCCQLLDVPLLAPR